jgi:hypothetical protein
MALITSSNKQDNKRALFVFPDNFLAISLPHITSIGTANAL